MDAYRTLAAEFRSDLDIVKGSRFLALLAPVSTAEAAQEHLDRARTEFPDASHHCQAWRLRGPGDVFRFGDDGEPGGSAGRPILQQIDGHGVVDVSIVVVRWFGGTKLGVGGLMRAYGGCAGRALDRAPIETVLVTKRVDVRHPYECSGAVQGLLAAWEIEPASADYGTDVHLQFDIPARDAGRFQAELLERTAALATVSIE